MNITERNVNNYSILSVKEWLEQGFEHGFMNGELDINDGNGRLWPNVYPGSDIKLLKQVHGIDIVNVTGKEFIYDNNSPSEADGWFIDLQNAPHNTAFGIKTADCSPVIIFINNLKIAYLLHCGWRSAVDNLFPKALMEIYNKYFAGNTANINASDLKNLRGLFQKSPELAKSIEICVGPSAKSCHYEVQSDVTEPAVQNFLALGGSEDMLGSAIVQRNGKTYFDAQELLRQQSLLLGIPAENFTAINICTINDNSYFSFRRQGPTSTPRQATFIKVS